MEQNNLSEYHAAFIQISLTEHFNIESGYFLFFGELGTTQHNLVISNLMFWKQIRPIRTFKEQIDKSQKKDKFIINIFS